MCAILPCLASTISGNVCAPGAFAAAPSIYYSVASEEMQCLPLILMAIKAKSKIWNVPMQAYHIPPQMP